MARRVTVTSNGDDLMRQLEDLVDSFAFTTSGADGDLGEEVVDIAVDGIQERSNSGLDADGQPFDANEDKYAAYKQRRYGVDRPGELGGQMLSVESLRGEVSVAPAEVTMTYGTGDLPTANARGGTPLKDSEAQATDRQKAEWFTESGRRFYELDDAISGKIHETVADFTEERIQEQGW